jgi:NADH:ubiquinone oxidoreductase subunit E
MTKHKHYKEIIRHYEMRYGDGEIMPLCRKAQSMFKEQLLTADLHEVTCGICLRSLRKRSNNSTPKKGAL